MTSVHRIHRTIHTLHLPRSARSATAQGPATHKIDNRPRGHEIDFSGSGSVALLVDTGMGVWLANAAFPLRECVRKQESPGIVEEEDSASHWTGPPVR